MTRPDVIQEPSAAHSMILDYPQAYKAGEATVGGKAFALAKLDRYGFRVPDGLVTAAEAYRRMLASPPIAELVAPLDTCQAEVCADEPIAARLAAVRDAIDRLPFDTELRTALECALDGAALSDVPLAVRSSAVGEDGRTHSFAGIHGSRLNVVGIDDVCTAVKSCWASLWTPAALAYRRHSRLGDDFVACAVLICRMIGGPQGEPTAAGVAFTCDPATGRRDCIVVNAVRGLADELVSGRMTPEQWIVDLRQISPAPVRQTASAESPRVLDQRQSLQLARIAERIHWALGDGQQPQDIEWAHDGQRFWIVQSRPVTRLPLYTLPAIKHLPVVWSNANVKDAVPGVLRPLSWAACKLAVDHILFAGHEAAGYKLPPGLETTRRIDGRAMLDLTMMQWVFYDSLGMEPKMLNEMLGGHQRELPLPKQDRPTLSDRWRKFRRILRLGLAASRLHRGFFAKCDEIFGWARKVWNDEDFTRLDGPDLIRRLEFDERSQRVGRMLVMAGIESSSLMLKDLLRRYLGDQADAVAAGLIACTGRVESAEHGLRLFALAEAARNSPAALELLSMPEDDPRAGDPAAWRRLPESCPFRRAMAGFLDDFGHRAVYEGEIANPRWIEDPTYLLDQVRAILEHPVPIAPREAAVKVRKAAEAKLRALPFFFRGWARRLARGAAEGGARREAGKSAMAAAGLPFRKAVLEVGRRMREAGMIDEVDDVFDLTLADVRGWLEGEWDGGGARNLIADRRVQREAWLAMPTRDVVILDADGNETEMPEVAASPAMESSRSTSASSVHAANRLSGIAASPGIFQGVARVVLDPRDGKRLKQGEILVAPSTDPGWTPLFLRAGAIVMQVGGYLSHGAIVAREFGLPAVVNVEAALERIRDGQPLLVDGDRGEVDLEPK